MGKRRLQIKITIQSKSKPAYSDDRIASKFKAFIVEQYCLNNLTAECVTAIFSKYPWLRDA
jgi:hypothetical protein